MTIFERKWPAVLLRPLAALYGAIVRSRNSCYRYGILSMHRIEAAVISIGNITVGGSGKTPTVMYTAEWLRGRGKRVCVLSRGYRRRSIGPVVVSDPERILAGVREAGDEPSILARRLPGIPVIVDRDRTRGARLIVKRFAPEVIVLDDGFQHRRLARDLDILTLSYPSFFGNGWLLPAGPLREPLESIGRAGLLWINGCDDPASSFPELEKWRTVPMMMARTVARGLVDSAGNVEAADLTGVEVSAFCGLASPDSFRRSLLSLGADVKRFAVYPDHFNYARRHLEDLDRDHRRSGTSLIITTEKDWIKLPERRSLPSHWRYLQIAVQPYCERVLQELVQRHLP